MRIQVLGQFAIVDDAANASNAVPTARMPRKMLALLTINASRMVPSRTLITELWDESPPKSAATTLQTYILHTRKHLSEKLNISQADIASNLLITRNLGYVFNVPPGQVDVHQYNLLQSDGLNALRMGDDSRAVWNFRQALTLWQGSPLMDVEHGRLVGAEVALLEQSRVNVIEQCIHAQLRLGQHRETLNELASLTQEHQFHESLHASYMLALYRSGWRARALEVFHRLRKTMVHELGLEPSPELHRLQSAILSSAPSLHESWGREFKRPDLAHSPDRKLYSPSSGI